MVPQAPPRRHASPAELRPSRARRPRSAKFSQARGASQEPGGGQARPRRPGPRELARVPRSPLPGDSGEPRCLPPGLRLASPARGSPGRRARSGSSPHSGRVSGRAVGPTSLRRRRGPAHAGARSPAARARLPGSARLPSPHRPAPPLPPAAAGRDGRTPSLRRAHFRRPHPPSPEAILCGCAAGPRLPHALGGGAARGGAARAEPVRAFL